MIDTHTQRDVRGAALVREDSLARAAITQSDEFHARHHSAFEKLMRLSFEQSLSNTHHLDSLRIVLPEDHAARGGKCGHFPFLELPREFGTIVTNFLPSSP